MSIHAIAYVSTSGNRLLAPEKMDRILDEAREFNQRYGVTGVLLHHDGNFLQYIEGAPDSINLVYKRILQSKSHYGIIELFNDAIDQRCFAAWSMGFAEATQTELQEISQATWLEQLNQVNGQSINKPGLVLLRGFWAQSSAAFCLL